MKRRRKSIPGMWNIARAQVLEIGDVGIVGKISRLV